MNEDVKQGVTQEVDKNELPWLTFLLCGNAYAVNSKYIDGITTPPDEITPIPDSPAKYIGMLNVRGNVFPLLDMRKQFKLFSIDEEIADFAKEIERFIELHKHRLDVLKNAFAAGGEPEFKTVSDVTKCEYSMWLEKKFHKKDKVYELLQKAEPAHRALHAFPAKLYEIMSEDYLDPKKGKHEEGRALIEDAEFDLQTFTDSLTEAEYNYRRRFRETIINLADGEDRIGILVDEVLGVGGIEPVKDSKNLNSVYQSKLFCGVAKSDKTEKEILIIDEELLIRQAAQIND
jgi:chemotaxis signal transduction protein